MIEICCNGWVSSKIVEPEEDGYNAVIHVHVNSDEKGNAGAAEKNRVCQIF